MDATLQTQILDKRSWVHFLEFFMLYEKKLSFIFFYEKSRGCVRDV